MPACVYREDVKMVFKQAINRFETISGLSHSKNRTEFYQKMTADINAKTGFLISNRFLQKKMASEVLLNFSSDIISIDVSHLNALYSYAIAEHHAEYEKQYPIGKNKASLIRFKHITNEPVEKQGKKIRLSDFPVDNPNYPSSPLIPFYYKDFQKVWIKDESYNVTGTIKDRWAWAIIKYYKKILDQYSSKEKNNALPRLSILSKGETAVALQYLLHKFNLPELNVVIYNQYHTRSLKIQKALKGIGAPNVTLHTFSDEKNYTAANLKKILNLKKHDIDITDIELIPELKKTMLEFYEDLAIEILEQNPDYCFVPYGSGLLLHSILETAKKEINGAKLSDYIDPQKIRRCTFYGAMPAVDNHTLLNNQYSDFLSSTLNLDEYKGFYCNANSEIFQIDDVGIRYAINEMDIANTLRRAEIPVSDSYVSDPFGLAGLALFIEKACMIGRDAKIIIVNTGKMKLDKFINSEKTEKTSIK